MDMRICITTGGRAAGPLKIEVFGLSLSLSGTFKGTALLISEAGGGATVSFDGLPGFFPLEDAAGVQDDGQAAGLPACEEAGPGAAAPVGQGLFEGLSALRKKISAEQGVPHYVVFHDNTLREMCRLLPADLLAMSAIQGVGKAKLDKYGEMFLAAIRGHTGAA